VYAKECAGNAQSKAGYSKLVVKGTCGQSGKQAAIACEIELGGGDGGI
jgi:hypothetical protein